MISLDGAQPLDVTSRCRRLLHGTEGTDDNRWWDKTQLIVDDEAVGLQFEHSISDGSSWNSYLNDVWAILQEGDESSTGGLDDRPQSGIPLHVDVDDKMRASIEKAKAQLYTDLIDNIHLNVVDFDGFGKDQIKQWGVSPDGFAQIAFQNAYTTLHGHNPATYEACSTRAFFHAGQRRYDRAQQHLPSFVPTLNSTENRDASFRAWAQICFEQRLQSSRRLRKMRRKMVRQAPPQSQDGSLGAWTP